MSATVGTQPVIKRSYKRVDVVALRQRASLIELDDSNAASPDDMLNEWNRSITSILDEFAPLKEYPVCKKKCKWLTTDVRGLMLQRDALARQIAEDPNPTEELIESCRKFKRKVKSRMRRASREYGSTMLASGESSRAWEFIREATFSYARGERVSMDLTVLNESFAEVVTNRGGHELVVPQTCNTMNSFEFEFLSSGRVEKLLNTMKTGTATGPNGFFGSAPQDPCPCYRPQPHPHNEPKHGFRHLPNDVEEGQCCGGVEG